MSAVATDLPPRLRFVLDRLAHADGVVSRWTLVDQISPGADDDGVIRMYVNRLRSVLGADAIQTVRGAGYQLTEKGRAAYARLSA